MKLLLENWRQYLVEQNYKVYKIQKGDTMSRLFGIGASFDRKDPLGRYNFDNISLALQDAGFPRNSRDENAKLNHPLGTGFEIRLPHASEAPDVEMEEDKSYTGRGFPEAEDEYLDLLDAYDEATTGSTAYARTARDKQKIWHAVVAQTVPATYMKKMTVEGRRLWKTLQKKYGNSIKIGFVTTGGEQVTGELLTSEPTDAKIYLYPIIIRNKRPIIWTPSGEQPLAAEIKTKIYTFA